MEPSMLRREGRVGALKRQFRQETREGYYAQFSDDLWGGATAKCQICGGPMASTECDVAHKRGRGRGGVDTLENVVCAHRRCHEFMDRKENRRKVLERSIANAGNGMVMDNIPAEMMENLIQYKFYGTDPHSNI